MLLIPRNDVKGMRHVRGVMSVPSLNLRQRGRVERSRESANIAVAQAILLACRHAMAARCRREGGRYE